MKVSEYSSPSVSRPFASAYLAGEASARGFFARDFRDPADRVERTRVAAARRADPALVAILREQQRTLAPSASRAANLDALAAGDTAVVATGQQVGLFLGPLYSFYKAASAVAVARALEREAGVRCVPLFWLQTEDHDFEEIAAITVADRQGAPTYLGLSEEGPDQARQSIAHRCLGAEIGDLLERLAEILPEGPAAVETLALLRQHYVAGRPIAGAFAATMAALFAAEGLLIFDPRQSGVAALAAPVYRQALRGAAAIEQGLVARGAALAAAGFDQQIAVRDGCSLLFFHRGDARGPRYRLQRAGADWSLAGADEVVPQHELERCLTGDCLRLSTSALLRPIVQDTLWPTAAYVGGPGELNYLAQLAPLYEHFGVEPPLAVPRARFRCLEARTRRLLNALGLEAGDLSRPEPELLALLVDRQATAGRTDGPEPGALRARVVTEVIPAVDELARTVAASRPELSRASERTRGSVAHALTRLLERYTRALAERDTVTRERLARVRAALLPDGVPQERVYAWPSLAGRIGPHAFTRLVMDALAADPFATEQRDLLP